MDKYQIITNNPLVKKKFKDMNIIYCDDLEMVMNKCRDLIHLGCQLVSHPLAGSVKPVQNPYRSIIITDKKESLDFKSLDIMENANRKVQQFAAVHTFREYPTDILKDYQVIDLSLIESGIKSLGSKVNI